jgi:MFS transporter, FSR family, fosmidomycin resistance protein
LDIQLSDVCRGARLKNLLTPLLLGIIHALIDMASGIVLASQAGDMSAESLVAWYLLYNACAFALQPLIGLAVDTRVRPRSMAIAGLVLVALALPIAGHSVLLSFIATGLGNAMYHVGAGVISYGATYRRASGSGVFIAPGALGVVAGRMLGTNGLQLVWPVVALCAVGIVYLALGREQGQVAARAEHKAESSPRLAGAIVALLLVAIAIRAYVGLSAVGWYRADPAHMTMLACAGFLGKGLGGIVADRLGWLRVSLVALLGSAAVFAIPASAIGLAATGVFLFQMVTAVTLTALYFTLPRYTGLCFGLNCLALFFGSLPMLLRYSNAFITSLAMVAGMAVVSSVCVATALVLLVRDKTSGAQTPSS